jgi:DNA gyrase/topoisomerase IV subunit A
MSKAPKSTLPKPGTNPGKVIDIDVSKEMSESYLEYAYSVIYSRAIPDARDGLKPVQRRIIYQMNEMNLRPDKGHVKCSRVVGDVMGKLHPHGDGAIYDALVRMAQTFSMSLPLVDGHGNFGSLDAGPAAMRYTESRLSAAAMPMVNEADEDTVDFGSNYDGQLSEPLVLPAAYPNLLVNGATGIAVGMATNMAPHNLVEVINATKHLIANPKATLKALMKFVPAPDFPTGGQIADLAGIEEAYATGKGAFKVRATTSIEKVTSRKQGIVITELPFNIGPEKIVEKIADLVKAKKLQGISDIVDLSDGQQGTRVVVEIKNGYEAEEILEKLYKLTPMEDQFSINAVALVNGKPLTLGLKQALEVFIEHRREVVRRRSEFRKDKYERRLNLVDGLLKAIIDIDKVIKIIRGSEDGVAAKEALIKSFKLTDEQATYILDMPLRRLTKMSKIELETESKELKALIAELKKLLASADEINKVIASELTEIAKVHGTPRRTKIIA